MSTFADLQQRLAAARYKRAILLQVVDHLDTEFRAVAGHDAVKVLLTDEKERVPGEAFESVVTDALAEVKELEEEINEVLGSTLSDKKAAEPAPVDKGKTKKTKKGKEKASGRDDAGSSDDRDPTGNGKPDERVAAAPGVQGGAAKAEGAGGQAAGPQSPGVQ